MSALFHYTGVVVWIAILLVAVIATTVVLWQILATALQEYLGILMEFRFGMANETLVREFSTSSRIRSMYTTRYFWRTGEIWMISDAKRDAGTVQSFLMVGPAWWHLLIVRTTETNVPRLLVDNCHPLRHTQLVTKVMKSREFVRAFEEAGWEAIRQRGSHVMYNCPCGAHKFVVPAGHKQISSGVVQKGFKIMKECAA